MSVVENIGGSSELIDTGTPAATRAGSGCSASDGADRVQTLDVGQTSSGICSAASRSSSSGSPSRADAVPDALGAEMVERVADGLRAGRLAGVRDAVQPGRLGAREVRRELRARHADLRAAEAEADQPVRT